MQRKQKIKLILHTETEAVVKETEEDYILELPKGWEKVIKPNQKVNVTILE